MRYELRETFIELIVGTLKRNIFPITLSIPTKKLTPGHARLELHAEFVVSET